MKSPNINANVISKHVKIKNSSKIVYITIMVSAIVIAFSLAILNSLYGQWRFNERLHAEKERVLDKLETNLANAKSLKSSFASLEAAGEIIPGQNGRPNSTVILDALPSRYDYPALATAMDVLAEESGVILDSFDGEDAETQAEVSAVEPRPIEIEYTMSVTGSYDQINQFMQNIERSIRPISLSDVALSGKTTELRGAFSMITYYQPTVDLNVITRTFK